MNFVRNALTGYDAFVSATSELDEEAAELVAERRRAAMAAAFLVLVVIVAGFYAVLSLSARGDSLGCGQPNCVTLVST